MRKSFIVAKFEFLVMLRRPSFRVMTILIPLLGLLAVLGFMVFQAFMAGGAGKTTVGYVDMAGVVTGFQEQEGVSFVPFQSDEEARKALLSRNIKSYYVIPPDYLATGLVAEYTRSAEVFASQRAYEPLEMFLVANVLAGSVPEQMMERVKAPALVSRVRLDQAGEPKPVADWGRFMFFYALSVLLIMAIFMSSGFLLQGIGEEKENRVMEVLLSSVTPWQLMTGKIVGLGAAGLLQIVVWVVAGRGILSLASGQIAAMAAISLPGGVALLGILYFILGYALFGTLLACLGAVTTTAREGQQISGIFVIPSIVPIYASVAIQGNPEGVLSRVLTFIPLTSPVTVMVRLAASGIQAWEITVSVLALVVAVLLALWATGRLFSVYLLMYGKRPSLREMWRALRGV